MVRCEPISVFTRYAFRMAIGAVPSTGYTVTLSKGESPVGIGRPKNRSCSLIRGCCCSSDASCACWACLLAVAVSDTHSPARSLSLFLPPAAA